MFSSDYKNILIILYTAFLLEVVAQISGKCAVKEKIIPSKNATIYFNPISKIQGTHYECKNPDLEESSAFNKPGKFLLNLSSPIIFRGNSHTAYRDPAVYYYRKKFYLFFTLVEIEPDSKIFSYTAMSTSINLSDWSKIIKITPRDQKFDYCGPGDVIRYKNQFILCLETYPRPNYTADQMPRFGDKNARIYIMRSTDLKKWSKPELIKVKGPGVSLEKMGRMIDPYLLKDKDNPDKCWCFFDTDRLNISYSYDLKKWVCFGAIKAGENPSVLVENEKYILFHSPKNGIGIKISKDLIHWKPFGHLITLGQKHWNWAKGRITAGTVLDLRSMPEIKKYIMFFHGSGPKTEKEGDFDKNASIGIAWSADLIHWAWPGKS